MQQQAQAQQQKKALLGKHGLLAVIIIMLIILVFEMYKPFVIVLTAVIFLCVLDIISITDTIAGYSNEGLITNAILFPIVSAVSELSLLRKIAALVFGGSKSVRFTLLRMMVPLSILSIFLVC